MLPPNSGVMFMGSGIVLVRPDRGRENAADARPVAVAFGSDDARGGGRALRADPQRHRAHEWSDGPAGGRRTDHHRDRLAGAARTRAGASDPAPLWQRGSGGTGAGQAHRATTERDARLASRIAAGDRPGPARGRDRQRSLDDTLAG